MPTFVTTVVKVEPMWRTFRDGTRKRKFWVIFAGAGHSAETWNAWQASLCERSIDQFPIRVGTRETRFGPEIVTVEPAESSVSRAGRI